MSDLISREYMKSLGATCIASRSKDGTLFPIVAIDELPSVQPEIIRCKDCRYYGTRECLTENAFCLGGSDYCSWAELRGEQDG